MSANELEMSPEPLGARATDPDPRYEWREERARLGGFFPAVTFTDAQVAVLNAVADTIIPAGNGFPPASEVEVVDFMARYVTPRERPVKYFPLAAEETFKKKVDDLGSAFVEGSVSDRTQTLKALEDAGEESPEGEFFGQLRALVYYGYYSSPVVTEAIRKNIPAADDYHGPPQPYGYWGRVEPWPDGMFNDRVGGYLATEDVVPIEIPDDLKAEYGVK